MNKKLRDYRLYIFYIISLFISSLGVAFSVKATLGTSPLVAIPNVLSIIFPIFSIGVYSMIFNIILILLELIILKNKFPKLQYLQFFVAIIYGYFIDISLYLIKELNPYNYITQWIFCIVGALILAFGIYLQLKSAVVYLPIDGFVLSIAHIKKSVYSKVKPFVDITLISIATIISLYYTKNLVGIREGTIFAAIFVGPLVGFYKRNCDKFINKHLKFINNI
ncbi:hypothetical protein BGI41_04535 [Methanobrevibacter sp. 87.7]|uniref:YczE/YyaS/YitT family protein n=1 Tax=Methanobrevibacter sp. 87.7 TaxID=387957 RepID=UPI000B505436|nr:DUF6198 family protein [Methanobrevibacter sp. 87.7]OWT33035.1 hypothetical protein BGI41_04535 [Methanobrevibacter sp. 87.7]